MPFTPNLRLSAPDPVVRAVGSVTKSISLIDDASYSLGSIVNSYRDGARGVYEVSYMDSGRKVRGRYDVMEKADVVTSALQRSSTVLTATVASGATEGIQAGMWVKITSSVPDYNGYKQVATTTATTLTFAVADAGATSDAGVATISLDAMVLPQLGPETVLWDSIIVADNQSENLGALRDGIYRVEFLDTSAKAAAFVSKGGVLTDMSEILVADSNGVSAVATVSDATSDSVTALFVSSGDVILRNGADIAAKLRVTFVPGNFCGQDQDGSVCLFSKNGELVLRNRLGATYSFEMARVS